MDRYQRHVHGLWKTENRLSDPFHAVFDGDVEDGTVVKR